jgi:hypothetical protein
MSAPAKSTILVGIIVAAAIAAVGVTAYAMITAPPSANATCPGGHHISVRLGDSGFSDAIIRAHRCDELTVSNPGSSAHQVGFGQHPYDLDYAGYHQHVIVSGGHIVISLTTTGHFPLHDHFDPEHSATLEVSP